MNNIKKHKHIIKWVLLGVLLISIPIIGYGTFIYYNLEQSKQRGMSQTKSIINEETELVDIKHIESFYGKTSYHVASARDSEDQLVFAFIPLNNSEDENNEDKEGKQNNEYVDEDVTIIKQSEVINKEKIYDQWTKRCSECKMIKIMPGMIDGDAIWELTYKDKAGYHVIESLLMENGEQIEQLSFIQRFK